jgi:hypothetical protein
MTFKEYAGQGVISIYDLSRECGIEVDEMRKRLGE